MADSDEPVLILGAGINGAALARELVLSGISVVVVDRADLTFGATAYSSRLIHGGLRYLEYGELSLVRESLAERTRLLRLAPQFVRPLQLYIPTRSRGGGLLASLSRLLRLPRGRRRSPPRGLWLIRLGLWLYDRYARDASLPRHRVHRATDLEAVPIDARKYPWLCSYHDAQIAYPERLVVALLEDARRIAEQSGVSFAVRTYHRVVREGDAVRIQRDGEAGGATRAFRPAAIVNATGAWVDQTLQQLRIASPPLMGGTKGSHFYTTHGELFRRLGGRAVYGEADDGRPVFVLPLGEGTLVGTTDIPYRDDPATAVATEEELQYLLRLVNGLFPDFALQRSDIDWHYSGVRPLPRSGDGVPASVTRRHFVHRHADSAPPLYSIIGGKLTTCRSLAEEATATIAAQLNRPVLQTSRQRIIPGGEDYPADGEAMDREIAQLAARFHCPIASAYAIWGLCGSAARRIVPAIAEPPCEMVAETRLPRSYVRWVIEHEWVQRLDDLVERRLMLLYQPRLTAASLRDLAQLLVEAGRLDAHAVEEEVARVRQRLMDHFGRKLAS